MKRLHISQEGFTLVELLIALAISLFLLAALVQIMASSSAAYRTSEGVSRIQEGGRYAMEIIGRQIRNAGYHSNNISQNLEPDLGTWPLNTAAAPGNFGVQGTDGPGGAPDTLTLRYYIASDCSADNNCVNAPVALNTANIVPDTWIEVIFSVDGNNLLRCDVLDSGGTRIINPPNQQLLEGVADMQILYGVSAGGGNMRYNDATTVTANGDWPNVVSVRLNLLMDSIERVTNQIGPNIVNGRLRRPYSATFTVRNRIPGA